MHVTVGRAAPPVVVLERGANAKLALVGFRRDKRERVAWLASRSSELDLGLSILGAILVTMVLVLRGEPFGIPNQFARFTIAMLIALWAPPIAAVVERAILELFARAPLRRPFAFSRAVILGEHDGVTSVLAGTKSRPRDWVLIRFGERGLASRFLKETPHRLDMATAIPSGESRNLGYLRELARVGATLAITSYYWNVTYQGATLKPVFGISALFLGGLVFVITLYRFAQKSVPAPFYRAIVEAMAEEQAKPHGEERLPPRGEGESYRAWLTRLSEARARGRQDAYRSEAALQASALESTIELGTEDERLAAAWLLGKSRVAADAKDVDPALHRVATAETSEEAEAIMLDIEPGTLHKRALRARS
ncbi:MAG: hypothetical protein U0174_17640 [Polyangiaceae bacterium]